MCSRGSVGFSPLVVISISHQSEPGCSSISFNEYLNTASELVFRNAWNGLLCQMLIGYTNILTNSTISWFAGWQLLPFIDEWQTAPEKSKRPINVNSVARKRTVIRFACRFLFLFPVPSGPKLTSYLSCCHIVCRTSVWQCRSTSLLSVRVPDSFLLRGFEQLLEVPIVVTDKIRLIYTRQLSKRWTRCL